MSQKNPRHKTKPRGLYSSPTPKSAKADFPHATVVNAAPFELREDGTIAAQGRAGTLLPAVPELIFHDAQAGIRLYHGNSLEILDAIIEKHPEGYFDCIFADPPYFLSNGGITCHAGKMVKVDKGDWDKSQGAELNHEFNRAWLQRCQRVLKPNGTIWVTGTHHVIFSVGFAMQQLGYKILNDIAWEKPNPPPNLSCRYFTHSTETILWAAKNEKSKHVFNYQEMRKVTGKQMKTVWRKQEFQPQMDTDEHRLERDRENTRAGEDSPSPGGPHNAKRSSLVGKPTGGGLGKPLGWGEGEHKLNQPETHYLDERGLEASEKNIRVNPCESVVENLGSVWTMQAPGKEEKQHGKHPTQKPVALIQRCLLASTHPHDCVLDPFMGAGTTAIACIRLQRDFVGIELDGDHFALSQTRADHETVLIWLRAFRVEIRVSVFGRDIALRCPRTARRSDPTTKNEQTGRAEVPLRPNIRAATQVLADGQRPAEKKPLRCPRTAQRSVPTTPQQSTTHHQLFLQKDLDPDCRSMDRIRWMEETPPKTDCIFHEVKFVFLSCAKFSPGFFGLN